MVIFRFFMNLLRTDNETNSVKHYVQIDHLRKIKRTKGRLRRNTIMQEKGSKNIPYVQVKQKNATKFIVLKTLILSYIVCTNA